MVAPGSLGVYKPGPPSKTMYLVLMVSLFAYSVGGGYMAGIQPNGVGWRAFSWHPMLMTTGMVGMIGAGAVTKKLGGYTNTKLHAIFSWLGMFMSMGGLYAIYAHKEMLGKKHLQTPHAIAGMSIFVSCIMIGMVGGVFLHPDFGMDKTNKTIRLAHKLSSRGLLMLAWFTAAMGLQQLTNDVVTLAMYAAPLVILTPLVLL